MRKTWETVNHNRQAPAQRSKSSLQWQLDLTRRPVFEPLERRLLMSHFRGGTMIPSVDATGLLTLTSTTYWRPTAPWGIDEGGNPAVAGLGTMTDVGADPIISSLALRTIDTSDARFTKIVQQHSIQLPGPGLYSISAESCCRVAGIINANESDWQMDSSIYWDGSNASTPINFSLNAVQAEVVRGANYSKPLSAVPASGLTLSYDQALNLNITSQPPGYTINQTTGLLTIPAASTINYLDNPTANEGADYAFSGNIFARDASGNLIGQVEFDNMFDAVDSPGHTPVANDATISGTVGQTLTHTFTGSDPDGDPLTWTFVGLVGPGNAPPAIAPSFNVVTQRFSWNSTGSVEGTWIAQVQTSDGTRTDIGDLTINLASTRLLWPLGDGSVQPVVTGVFGGNHASPLFGHLAEDYRASVGQTVIAFADGRVIAVNATDSGQYGKYVLMEHVLGNRTIRSLYAHLSKVLPAAQAALTTGAILTAGTPIAQSGDTPSRKPDGPTDAHLHFAVFEPSAGTLPRGYAGKEFTESSREITVEGSRYFNPSRLIELGFSLTNFQELGVLSSVTHSALVGPQNQSNSYRFTLQSPSSQFKVILEGLNADADLQLIRDANNNGQIDLGEVIQTANSRYKSSPTSSLTESIEGDLSAGTYFIRVYATFANGLINSTNYSLRLSALPALEPGQTSSQIKDIGVLDNDTMNLNRQHLSRIYVDSLGPADNTDVYRFRINDGANFAVGVDLDEAAALLLVVRDVNVNGQIDNGDVLVSSAAPRQGVNTMVMGLAKGQYLLRLEFLQLPTSYRLTTLTTFPAETGKKRSEAKNLGPIAGGAAFYDQLGSGNEGEDFFRFRLIKSSTVSLFLRNLTLDSKLELQDRDGRLVVPAVSSGNSGVASMQHALVPGVYFVRLSRNDKGNATTDYRFIFDATTPPVPSTLSAGGHMWAAQPVGVTGDWNSAFTSSPLIEEVLARRDAIYGDADELDQLLA